MRLGHGFSLSATYRMGLQHFLQTGWTLADRKKMPQNNRIGASRDTVELHDALKHFPASWNRFFV